MWNMWNVLESVPTNWCHLVPITSTHLIWLICGAPWCSMVQLFVLLCRPLPGLADGRHFRNLSIRSGSRCKDLLKMGAFHPTTFLHANFSHLVSLKMSQADGCWLARQQNTIKMCQNKSICLKVAGCWGSLSKRKLWIWIYLDWRFLFSFNQSRQQEGDTPVDSKDWDANSEGASLSSILSTVLYIANWFRHVPMSSTIAAQYIYTYIHTYIHI